jgi:sugar phosphate isomerase/epimerase
MRPLSFSTNAFKKNSLEEAIRAVADVGYAGVELMADLHHAYPTTFDRERRAATHTLLNQRKMFVSNINAFTHFVDGDTYHPTWIEHDESLRHKRIDHTIRCIELAAEFGAKTVSVQPGGPLIGTGLSPQDAFDRFAAALAKVLPAAQKHNVTIAVEPEPGLLIQTAEEYLAFKTQFFAGEPLVRMNCDIGHLFCVGDDPASVIRSLPDQVAHVHVEDIGKNRVHQHLTPGKGVIDFSTVFSALHDIGYDGQVTVELYPYETSAAGVAAAAIEHLRRVA